MQKTPIQFLGQEDLLDRLPTLVYWGFPCGSAGKEATCNAGDLGSIFIYDVLCMNLLQLCLTLCNPLDCSPPGSSVHGILQARILEWVAIPFSRGSSWPRDQTQVSCIAGRFFTV